MSSASRCRSWQCREGTASPSSASWLNYISDSLISYWALPLWSEPNAGSAGRHRSAAAAVLLSGIFDMALKLPSHWGCDCQRHYMREDFNDDKNDFIREEFYDKCRRFMRRLA